MHLIRFGGLASKPENLEVRSKRFDYVYAKPRLKTYIWIWLGISVPKYFWGIT